MLTGLCCFIVSVVITSSYSSPALDDFEPLEDLGEVTASNPETCHTITIVDDNFIEPPEDMQATLHPVFNVADVELLPDVTTVTIVDDDGKNITAECICNSKLLLCTQLKYKG